MLSLEKNNLGRLDVPALRYVIRSTQVPTAAGPADVGLLNFIGESDRTVGDILLDGRLTNSARNSTVAWLIAYLEKAGGSSPYSDVRDAALVARISESSLKRARVAAGVVSDRVGFHGGAIWGLPSGSHSDHSDQYLGPELNGLSEPNDDLWLLDPVDIGES